MADEITAPNPKASGHHYPDAAQVEHPPSRGSGGYDNNMHIMNEKEALEVSRAGGWQVDALITEMEDKLAAEGGLKTGIFHLEFQDPRHFTWLIIAFASMGGMLSGLDQSLISGANLYLPGDLGLDTRQNSLVNSAMPLGAVGGALLLSPCNEMLAVGGPSSSPRFSTPSVRVSRQAR